MATEFVNLFILNPLLWFLLILAVAAWFATGRNKWLRLSGVGVFLALWVLGTRPVAEFIIQPLETQYLPPSIKTLQAQHVQQVVVLSGGGYPVEGELRVSALPPASQARFLSGVELCTQIGSECRLLFSGSAGQSNESIAVSADMETLARRVLPQTQIASESKSNDTADHPINVKPFVGGNTFVLVTSAYHMPRAMMVFGKAGLHPLPCPVDRYVHGHYDWRDLLPSSANLQTIQIALHEYVGLLWYSFSVHYESI